MGGSVGHQAHRHRRLLSHWCDHVAVGGRVGGAAMISSSVVLRPVPQGGAASGEGFVHRAHHHRQRRRQKREDAFEEPVPSTAWVIKQGR